MRVLLTTFGSRGDVQPLLALAVALQALGMDARVCAPPDAEFVSLFAAAGVPLLPAFATVRDWVAEMLPKRATISLPKVAAQVMAAQYEAISAAAHAFDGERCDVLVATGLFSSVAAARAVAEKQDIRYVFAAYCPIFLPSPYQRPFEYPSHRLPADVTDNRELWDRDIQVVNDLFGEGLNTLRAHDIDRHASEILRCGQASEANVHRRCAGVEKCEQLRRKRTLIRQDPCAGLHDVGHRRWPPGSEHGIRREPRAIRVDVVAHVVDVRQVVRSAQFVQRLAEQLVHHLRVPLPEDLVVRHTGWIRMTRKFERPPMR
jgi:hypothetical protein